MEWKAVLFYGLETNVEVTRCGKVRKVRKYWYGFSKYCSSATYGEIDFSKLKLHEGYRQVGIQIYSLKPRNCNVHQLIAAAFLGYKFQGWKLVVDHIDSNKLNNHIDNLRIVTQRENISKEKSLKSGLPTGVIYDKERKKYRSEIIINKKRFYLGRYNTIEEASNAYELKLKEL
jgi:hypothetical protein